MRGHGLAGPDGTDFFRGVVANGENKIEFRCVGSGEFVPAFAAETAGRNVGCFELRYGFRADGAGWIAPGTVGCESWSAFEIHEGLGHDGARRIAGAEEQDVVMRFHGR